MFLNELGDWELGTITSLDLFPAQNHFQRITSQRKSQAGGAIPKMLRLVANVMFQLVLIILSSSA